MKIKASVRRAHFANVSLIALAIATTVSGHAFAQEEAADTVDEVVVTGSRTIRDGAQAPTPVTVVAVEQLNNASPRNLTESLAQLPGFRGSSTTTTASSSASSNTVGSYLNLRNLSPNRTLVLLDGRRVAPGNTDGAVNIDLLPQPLVRRVDVVTGGASAAYGSDAVAGVVNFVLDSEFTGVKGLVQGGISDYGDAGAWKAEISAGGRYLDDKLHVIASYGLRRSNPVYEQLHRRWAYEVLPGRSAPATAFTGLLPTNNVVTDFRQTNTIGGVILGTNTGNPSTLANLQFLPGGVVGGYNTGDPRFLTAASQVGGDGSSNYVSLSSLTEGKTAFLRGDYDVTDNLQVFLQAGFSDIHNRYDVSAHSLAQTAAITIFNDNYYLPTTVRTLLNSATFSAAQLTGATGCNTVANPATMPTAWLTTTPARCFKLNRFNLDLGRLIGDIQSASTDLVAGFRSEIFGGYRFSGYWEHGQNKSRTLNENNIWFEHYFAAVDTIANPTVALGGRADVPVGAPVCRASLSNPIGYRDCMPLNVFGAGSPSAEAKAYVYGTGFFGNKARQDVWALDFAGEPFELPAGPLSFAVGAEYRTLDIAQYSGGPEQNPGKFVDTRGGVRGAPPAQIGVPGSYGFSNLLPFSGGYEVKEGYLELDVPLLKDLPLVQELSLNTAGRYTDYSTSGAVKTWKIGLSYRPADSFRLRGTISRDIRAPSPQELFATGSRFLRTFNDPFNNNQPTQSFDVTIGNPTLQPEVADTLTAGVVFQPNWIPGLTASVDYYEIEINDAIQSLSSQETLNRCFNEGSPAICANIDRDPPAAGQTVGQITLVRNSPLNFAKVRASGFDFELGYRFEPKFIPGMLNARLLMGFLQEASSQVPGGAVVDQRGMVTGEDNPKMRGSLQVNWDNGPVSLFVQQSYVSEGVFDANAPEGLPPTPGATSFSFNRVPSYTMTTLTARYKFGAEQNYEAFLTVNNLFNKDPWNGSSSGSSATTSHATNNSLYDVIGRYYTTGLRFRF